MTGEERGKAKSGPCDAVEGGYTIFLDEERIRSFMDGGDFSSASELGHFKDIGAQIEKRMKERGGAAFLALSTGEKGLSRDFAVLQLAHVLAQHGKSVLVVDCDFLHPGLSGLVENIEEHGFLDLLLYGSSLKTVARPIGIESVSVTGAGSFPVSRTIPFALKEFEKIREFLRAKHDVVIYCSTLYTEDSKINPLAGLVDGVVLCCRIEDMPEGELQKNLKSLGAEKVPPVDLVCFCGKRPEAHAAAPAAAKAVEKKAEPAKAAAPAPPRPAEPAAGPLIEKSDELEPLEAHETEKKPRVNVPRMAVIVGAIVVAAFAIWWIVISRTVTEKQGRGTASTAVGETTGTAAASQAGQPASAAPESAGAAAASDTAQTRPAGGASQQGAPPAAAPVAKAPPAGRTGSDTLRSRIPSGPGRYTIHVASFKEMARAEVEKAYLEKNGFPARIIEVDIKGDKWLRVLVGEYATTDEATKARLDLLGLSKIGYARIATIEQASH
ncbi:MAG: SPOR domain-containing protein [Candidatus Krumholzibacteriaceae bacterium]|jgi:cell division protein FtsN